MAFFSGKQKAPSKRRARLVATGKRVKGTWIMESTLPVKARRSRRCDAIIVGENRRVRTLH
ncbi:MAG: hypothetical protein D6815_02845 [Candidatus Dadabacteria bacterium]|nr:MAG: hypothetical protein D6815_02845 [Candidatus Dadabacteria bacterium]